MHPVNRLLYHVGMRVSRSRGLFRLPPDFLSTYKHNLALLGKNGHGFDIFREMQYDLGTHPESYVDYECTFAAQQIGALKPGSVLDIGSYRHFVLGLLSHFDVTTIDVRNRQSISENETVITCDAKRLPLRDESFSAVVSLCALEHFGLGRYGDEFDLDADRKALREMRRVLMSHGHLILTTTITRAKPSIGFNAHRIYNYEMLKELFGGLVCKEERFYSSTLQRYCSFEEVTTEQRVWDVYCGCWEKS
jgi:SAM-dependent methyltransferase